MPQTPSANALVINRFRSTSGGHAGAPAVPERDLLAFIRSAMEWRTLVRMMWIELGKPPVPGFPASRVTQILAGDLPADNGFFTALLETLTSRSRRTETLPVGVCRICDPESADSTNMLRIFIGKSMQKWHSAALAAATDEEHSRVVDDLHDNLVETLSSQPLPGRSTLDPSAIETEAEFMAALRALKKRTRLSYRSIEERSKTTTGGWLPRATAADMLRRDTLPRADTLWAFTSACGLPKQEQDKWEATRSRLSARHRAQRHAHGLKEVVIDAAAFDALVGDDLDGQAA